MTRTHGERLTVHDFAPESEQFREDVLAGLARSNKELPCKYLYDQQGSALFDRICELDEYYPTRTEAVILDAHAAAMAEHIGPGCLLIEFGSGSSRKTEILLDALREPSAYVPIDISKEHLIASARRLATRYPRLEILPVCADFTDAFELPAPRVRPSRRVVFFPGSTLGNFSPSAAARFLRRIATVCGPGGGLLIGVDLEKDHRVLERAYNDAQGVTAAFNLNLLDRINRELDGDFDLDQFEHQAHFNADAGRIEMHLVSTVDQTVRIGGDEITFDAEESILSECSYKRTVEDFENLARETGFEVGRIWTDPREWFSVWYLTVATS